MRNLLLILISVCLVAAISACREDELVVPTEYEIIPDTPADRKSVV